MVGWKCGVESSDDIAGTTAVVAALEGCGGGGEAPVEQGWAGEDGAGVLGECDE